MEKKIVGASTAPEVSSSVDKSGRTCGEERDAFASSHGRLEFHLSQSFIAYTLARNRVQKLKKTGAKSKKIAAGTILVPRESKLWSTARGCRAPAARLQIQPLTPSEFAQQCTKIACSPLNTSFLRGGKKVGCELACSEFLKVQLGPRLLLLTPPLGGRPDLFLAQHCSAHTTPSLLLLAPCRRGNLGDSRHLRIVCPLFPLELLLSRHSVVLSFQRSHGACLC